MKTNFHTHNYRCLHAVGEVEDYVKKAIEEKFTMIGISDHAPMPKYFHERMKIEELDCYIEEIKVCKEKYKNQITVYSGLEIEYFVEEHQYYEELLKKVDYLVLAPHDFKYKNEMYCAFYIKDDEILKAYFEILFKGIKSGYFKYAAHPDLFAYSYYLSEVAEEYTHKLAKLCLEYDFILEFNANGFRRGKKLIHGEERYPYPYMKFWDIIKQYKVKTIVNSDCHNPKLLNDEFDNYAIKVAKEEGFNLVETIF